MTQISCKIIQDLLPLYLDGVCSPESKELVETHLADCPDCQRVMALMQDDNPKPVHLDDTRALKGISKKWKADKVSAFLKGAGLISLLASFASFMMYNLSPSYVAEDGTVVEAFASSLSDFSSSF